jgi:hypothetical protein
MTEANVQDLFQENVVPDVLPQETVLSHGLTVKWPKETLDVVGKELDREATQSEPLLYLSPVVWMCYLFIFCRACMLTALSAAREA